MIPDCYKCKHRETIPGDAHSRCVHPKCRNISEDPLLGVFSILSSVRGGLPPIKSGLRVRGNPVGIRHGWFNHPLNFDPHWLEECDGFEVKGGETS